MTTTLDAKTAKKVFKYHIALGRSLDFETMDRDVRARKCPRHANWRLSQQLGATIHQPEADSGSLIDRMRAKIVGRPELWAFARALSSQLTGDDLVYCTGEDIGIPIATLCGAKQDRPKIVVFIHNSLRPRGLLALKLFSVSNRVDLFVTNIPDQADFLRRYLQLPATRVSSIPEQTDTKFFTPGPTSPNKSRPIVASVGLERRDFYTLAKATWDLDVDVKISAFSQEASVLARSFPKDIPNNMSRRFYEWPELVQLYRDADIVVVSLLENQSTSGITTLLEAMSCRRPVVITKTQGLACYLATPGAVTVVNPGDPDGLRQAIVNLLNNPQVAEAQAERGYQLALKHYNSEQFIENLALQLSSI